MAIGVTRDRTEPCAGATSGGVPIGEAARDIRHPGPFVEREQLDPRALAINELVNCENPFAGMLQKVCGQLGGDERDARDYILGEADTTRDPSRHAPRLANAAPVAHRIDRRQLRHAIASNVPA